MILNLLDRMKLPFRKNKEFLSALYDILGFYPHNLEIYRIAFSHKSLGYHREADNRTSAKDRRGNASAKDRRKSRSENTAKPLNNERLEYLGDAVLESVVSDILFRHFPHKREGFLTSTRSKIVQREALNRLATDMGLEKLILAAQGTRMAHTNIGGNAFEALMGAIYLDRGYKHCHWFISNRIVGRYVNLDNVAQKEVNFKSKLLEWSQKNRININFKDSAADDRGFKTIITMEGITLARGNGRSKKESQQEASKEALTRMRREPKTYDSIFRAKEKRTAMEAEESFALPKIDEIENTLSTSRKGNKAAKSTNDDAPVLEERKDKRRPTTDAAEAAYDTAYDESASFEVIDTPPIETQLTADVYEEKGLPAPPEEDELRAADEKLRKKRTRNRGPKTVGDAVKGVKKGETTAQEKAEKRNNERLAEVERQRAKAERKRQQKQAQEQQTHATEEAETAKTNIEAETKFEAKANIIVETETFVEAPIEASTDDYAEASTTPQASTEATAEPQATATGTEVPIESKSQEVESIIEEDIPETNADTASSTDNTLQDDKEMFLESGDISQDEEFIPATEEVTSSFSEEIVSTDSQETNSEEETTVEEEAISEATTTSEEAISTNEDTTSSAETVPSEETTSPASPLTFDAIVFSSEHDDNLGLLHEEETIEPVQESEANEAAEQAPSPSAQRKRKSRRRPHPSAKKAKEGNPQTGDGSPKEVNEPSKASDKSSNKDSKKSPNKRPHRRRRPSSGHPNKGEASTAQPQ